MVVCSHPGANLAPWNIGRYNVSAVEGTVSVDGQPLVFVHYQSFKLISRSAAVWVSWSRNKEIRRSWKVLPKIYLAELQKTMRDYQEIFKDWNPLFSFRGTAPGKRESRILALLPGKFLKQLVHIIYVAWCWRKAIFFSREK